MQRLKALYAAKDYVGVVDLKVEARKEAVAILTVDPSNSAYVCRLLGGSHMQVHLYQEAIGFLNTARLLYEEIQNDKLAANHVDRTKDHHHLCWVCTSLATCYRSSHCFENAIVLYDRALVMAEEAGDRQALRFVKSNLGGLYQLLGQHDTAIGLLKQASAMAVEVGEGHFLPQSRTLLPRLKTV
jgi:tetratricopeptide (TPR) repeat protein